MNPTHTDSAKPLVVQSVNWHGLPVKVVRDDLNHPIIQGNKWRKLLPNLDLAVKQQHQTIVTFGGAHSNHLLATAYAAKAFGLQAVGWVRGEELAHSRDRWSQTLMDSEALGMRLVFVSRGEYREKQRSPGFQKQWAEYDTPLLLPEGGSNELATQGVAALVQELSALGHRPSHLICPVGTGGTVAGLIRGVAAERWDCQVIGVCVLKSLHSVNEKVNQWLKGLETLPKWHINHNHHCGGYAKCTPELIQFAQTFSAQNQIPLDKIYNAKSFFACDQWLHSGQLGPGDRPMIIHTGGLQGGCF